MLAEVYLQVSLNEAAELIEFSKNLREEVISWLRLHHPELSPWKT